MATTYVPVPFPAWSPRNSTRTGSSIPLRNAADETPAGDGGTTGGSVGLAESPVSLKLVGYEILEKRSKFTVYKILVKGRQSDGWLIFRRYSDFSRLSDELKQLFPGFGATLPPKRFFKDNYEKRFLDGRRVGLQTFLQDLTSHRDIVSSEAVRSFLLAVGGLSPFGSLEESRAVCETLEENNHYLQVKLMENQREIDNLKKVLAERENHISILLKKFKSSCSFSKSFEESCLQTARKLDSRI